MSSRNLEEDIEEDKDVIASFDNFPKLTRRSYHNSSKIPKKNYIPTLQFLLSQREDYHFDELAAAVHVSPNLLRHWQEELRKDPNFNPAEVKFTNKRNRTLSDALEDEMIGFIEKYYINPGYYFDNRICRGVCFKIWLLRAQGKDKEVNFKASRNWATRFMHKYGYSLRKAHAKRRPGKTIEFVSRMKNFYKEMHDLYHKHAAEGTLHLLLNVDETSWKVVYRGELTYAKIGSDTVRINDIDDDKACITSIATITADYTAKMPLCVIGKGVTERCCKQFEIEDDSDIGVFFSSSGWAKETVILQYLKWLKPTMLKLFKDKGMEKTTPIDLIWDTYTAHTSEAVRKICKTYNINLHYVPAGATDLLQPLDIAVFGSLKQLARKYWRDDYLEIRSKIEDPYKKEEHIKELQTRTAAVKLLRKVWDEVGEKTLRKAWEVYSQPYDENRFDSILASIPEQSHELSEDEFLKDKRTIYDIEDCDDEDDETDGDVSKSLTTYDDHDVYYIEGKKQLDNMKATERPSSASPAEKKICTKLGMNCGIYNEGKYVGTIFTEKNSSFAAFIQLLYQIPFYNDIIENSEDSDFFKSVINCMNHATRIADLTRYNDIWLGKYENSLEKAMMTLFKNSEFVGFNTSINGYLRTSSEEGTNEQLHISETSHMWILNVPNDDLMSGLDAISEPYNDPANYVNVHVDFNDWKDILIVKNARDEDENISFVFPNGFMYEDNRYILSSVINRWHDVKNRKEAYSILIHENNGDTVIADEEIRKGRQNHSLTFLAVYIKATKEKQDECIDQSSTSMHISLNSEEEESNECTYLGETVHDKQAGDQSTELNEEENGIDANVDTPSIPVQNKNKKNKEVVYASKEEIAAFRSSVVGQFIILDESFCTAELSLRSIDIIRLTTAFSSIAKRMANKRNGAKPKRKKRYKSKHPSTEGGDI